MPKGNKEGRNISLESYAQGKAKSERLSDEQKLKGVLSSACGPRNVILPELQAEGSQVALGPPQRNEKCPKTVIRRKN